MLIKWIGFLGFILGFHQLLAVPCYGANIPTEKDTVNRPIDYTFVEKLSEKELIILIDSLSDAVAIPCDLIVRINNLIAERERTLPKNDFAAFSVYPADAVYGKWDTKNLFPYGAEMSRHDTTILLTLTGGQMGNYFHPVGGVVTSPFGWRDSTQHQGVDIELHRGDAVSCAFDGMVRIAMRSSSGYGNVVVVRHNNGLETLYAHLYKIKVKPGDFVYAGQTLGLGGSTGHSTGAHLHFETRYKGVPINPKYFISFDDHALVSADFELKKTRWGYTAAAADASVYTVQKGDNLYDLSRQFMTSVARLKELNGFTRYPRLKAGDKLIVRKQEGKF
jgi:murein DD-endopeptidase MepM/ murein hydrolase activator NlpD